MAFDDWDGEHPHPGWAQSAEERFGAVLRSVGTLLMALGGDPRSMFGAPSRPREAAGTRSPAPGQQRAGMHRGTETRRTADVAEDITDEVEFILRDARQRAQQVIDRSLEQARELLIDRPGGADRTGVERIERAIADLTTEVRDVQQRLARVEETLRRQRAAAAALDLPAVETPADFVPPQRERPASPAAPPQPPSPAPASERPPAVPEHEPRPPAERPPEDDAAPAPPVPPSLTIVTSDEELHTARPQPAGAPAEPEARPRPFGEAPAPPDEPWTTPEPAPAPAAPPEPPARGMPPAQAASRAAPAAAPHVPQPGARGAELPAAEQPPTPEEEEAAEEEDAFAPNAGGVILRISPVAGFQGLMNVQEALARMSQVREAVVEAYSQGEARLRLQLGTSLSTTEVAAGLSSRLGRAAHVQSSSAADRTIEVSLR